MIEHPETSIAALALAMACEGAKAAQHLTREIMTTAEAAEYLRIQPSTLNTMRTRGGGPAFGKLGGSIRYRKCDLDRWVASRVFASTSEAA